MSGSSKGEIDKVVLQSDNFKLSVVRSAHIQLIRYNKTKMNVSLSIFSIPVNYKSLSYINPNLFLGGPEMLFDNGELNLPHQQFVFLIECCESLVTSALTCKYQFHIKAVSLQIQQIAIRVT